MNYLGHLYLSGKDEKLLTGNFIGDYVKGRNYLKYPVHIQKGILLHRQIDSFTDQHPKFREAKKILRSEFGLFSGIIVDLIYDHLLATNWNRYSTEHLHSFAGKVHAILLSNYNYLPSRVQFFLPSLIQNKRLESYATIEGMQNSLQTMSRYTPLPNYSEKAVELLQLNHQFLIKNFSSFMKDTINFVELEFGVKIEKPD